MRYFGVDGQGYEWELKAANELDALLEAYDDMDWGFHSKSRRDFDYEFREGQLNCRIGCYADDAAEDDDPVASASIDWEYELEPVFNEEKGYDEYEYRLKQIRVSLFDDTELTISGQEDFSDIVKKAMSND